MTGRAALEARANRHGITTSYEEREVPDSTLHLILDALGDADPVAPADMAVPSGVACHLPADRGWGIFCQLYELRSARQWGIGDFADLADLARICGAAGADFLGINPVHALFTAAPSHASPFSPSNRRFLNPLYIAPDLLGCARPALPDGDLVDYDTVAVAKMTALRDVFDGGIDDGALDAFVAAEGRDLTLHATFEAASHLGLPLPADPDGPETRIFQADHAPEIRFHLWLQMVARAQLHAAQAAAKAAGMGLGLYLDLAVGEAQDGSAVWSGAAVNMPGLDVGAPPDMFSEQGQNWQLAAPSPTDLAARGYAPFRAMIAAQLRDAGALRIDHAMALWQLFLIPAGRPAAEGAHLRYPMQDMLRVLSEESKRHGAVVIGEDLGWVPEGFQDAMEAANILSYRIVYFEQDEEAFRSAGTYPEKALACLSTHDLPVLAGWWRGDDIEGRLEHGLVSSDATVQHRAHRQVEREMLVRAVGASADPEAAELPEAVLDAAHAFVASTPCLLAGVRLADLIGPQQQTNRPGTTGDYPNWRPRGSVCVDAVADHPTFARIAAIMRAARPRPS